MIWRNDGGADVSHVMLSSLGAICMEWLDSFRSHAVALPNLAKFAIVMAIIAGAPALARRLRIPDLVGLVAFGILLGPYVPVSYTHLTLPTTERV